MCVCPQKFSGEKHEVHSLRVTSRKEDWKIGEIHFIPYSEVFNKSICWFCISKQAKRDFPGGPVVKTSNAGGVGSIPGR